MNKKKIISLSGTAHDDDGFEEQTASEESKMLGENAAKRLVRSCIYTLRVKNRWILTSFCR